MDETVLEWVASALRQSHPDEKRFRDEDVAKLNSEHARLQKYEARLDGRVDLAFFDRKSREWRDEQSRILREIEGHQAANESYMEAGIRILELSETCTGCSQSNPPTKNADCSISWYRTAHGRAAS